MMKTASCGKMLLLIFIAVFPSVSPGAHYNVSNPSEFQAALNSAENNGQNDTIHVQEGHYDLISTMAYSAAAGENCALSIVGDGAYISILDGQSSVKILFINTTGATDDDHAAITLSGLSVQ
ncbi:MAG: hypothetical protein NTZ78_09670 [Candidatus Aureabacteria bacterium]|nr:hypothetical protein [Candidatus Auribacterota bacterium]